MKVETPQLRWHQIINPQSQKDAGANGPILSCSLLSLDAKAGVLATAGNAEVNLWRVGFTDDAARSSPGAACGDGGGAADGGRRSAPPPSRILVQPLTKGAAPGEGEGDGTGAAALHTRVEHVATLSRGTNERGVNAVRFSPSGSHLVAAGDGGAVAVWAAPADGPPGRPAAARWAGLARETDAPVRVLFNRSDDVMDVAWGSDGRRFAVCSLDHTVAVWELTSPAAVAGAAGAGDWRCVHRSAKDHTHYVQGVAYDPQGVYLASMGSDRMVKVYSRKHVKNAAVREELRKHASHAEDPATPAAPAVPQARVRDLLATAPFALQGKVRTLKFLEAPRPAVAPAAEGAPAPPHPKRHHMFADELTLGSFFRRLAFTPDGAFLVVPAALWHGSASAGDVARDAAKGAPGSPTSVAGGAGDALAASSFATYLFARHRFDRPFKVLAGLEKPSVAIRPNPVLFKLPPDAPAAGVASHPAPLPYRSVFAVLTADTVLLYDTHHDHPLALARGLHYAGLTDAAWSADGRTLFVTSSDGYVSILSFERGELGDPWATDGPAGGARDLAAGDATVGEAEASGGGATAATPQKVPPVAPAAAEQERSAERRTVTFAAPLVGRSQLPVSVSDPQPLIHTLVPKKKKKKAPTPSPSVLLQERPAAGGDVAPSPAEKKRPAEEPATLSADKLREGPINILLPKKKKTVSLPTPTEVA